MGGLLPRQLHLAWIHRDGNPRPPPEGVEGEVERDDSCQADGPDIRAERGMYHPALYTWYVC